MSKGKKNKGKTASRRKTESAATPRKAAPRTTSTRKRADAKAASDKTRSTIVAGRSAAKPRTPQAPVSLIFGADTYKWLGASFGLILLGLLLMTGGGQPDPNQWDPGIIYSPLRITLAPLIILVGIGVAVYAVLKK